MIKNNTLKNKIDKMNQDPNRFSIRKLTVGAASVLVGLSLMSFGGHTVHAADVNKNDQQELVKPADKSAAAANQDEKKVVTPEAKPAADQTQVAKNVEAPKAAEQKATESSAKPATTETSKTATPEAKTAKPAEKKSDAKETKDAKQYEVKVNLSFGANNVGTITVKGKLGANGKAIITQEDLDKALAANGNTLYKIRNNYDYTIDSQNPDAITAAVVLKDWDAGLSKVKDANGVYSNDIVITKYTGEESNVVVPNNVDLGIKDKVRVSSNLFQRMQTNSNVKSISFSGNGGAKVYTYEKTPSWAGSNAFGNNPHVEHIDLRNLVFDKATEIGDLFANDTNLKSVDLTGVDFGNIANASGIFYNDKNLTEIKGLETLDTSHFTDMSFFFFHNEKLTHIDGITNWDVSNVKTMANMFQSDYQLNSVDLSGWNTKNADDMDWMFAEDKNLTQIKGLENLNVSKVKNFAAMFSNTGLSKYDLSNWNMNAANNLTDMFENLSSPATITLPEQISDEAASQFKVSDFQSYISHYHEGRVTDEYKQPIVVFSKNPIIQALNNKDANGVQGCQNANRLILMDNSGSTLRANHEVGYVPMDFVFSDEADLIEKMHKAASLENIKKNAVWTDPDFAEKLDDVVSVTPAYAKIDQAAPAAQVASQWNLNFAGGSNGSDTPDTPVIPDTPVVPDTPDVPAPQPETNPDDEQEDIPAPKPEVLPDENEAPKPHATVMPAVSSKLAMAKTKVASTKSAKHVAAEENKLPQTGAEKQGLAVIGLALVSLASLFGLATKKRKD